MIFGGPINRSVVCSRLSDSLRDKGGPRKADGDPQRLSQRLPGRSALDVVHLGQPTFVGCREVEPGERLPVCVVSIDRQDLPEPSERVSHPKAKPQLVIHHVVDGLIDHSVPERRPPDERSRLHDVVVQPQESVVVLRHPHRVEDAAGRIGEDRVAVHNGHLRQPLEHGDGQLDGVRPEVRVVRVQPSDKVPAALDECLVDRRGLPGVRLTSPDQARPFVRLEELDTPIRGGAVHHNVLDVLIRLVGHGGDVVLQPSSLVVRGRQD